MAKLIPNNDLKDVHPESNQQSKQRRYLQSATRVQRVDRRPKYAEELMVSKVALDCMTNMQPAGTSTNFGTGFITNHTGSHEDLTNTKQFYVVPIKSQQFREDIIRQQ